MKAVIWKGKDIFEVEEVDKPVPSTSQVLVKVDTASICTTDFHYENFKCIPPIIPGHEVAGVVVEVGSDVNSLNESDRVTLDPVQRCGRCYCCTHEIEHLCINTRHLGASDVPGGWAEYIVIDAANAYIVPQNVELESAALTEPVAVCLESFKRAQLKKGDSVLVLGDGTFGFIHAAIAKILGAGIVIVAGHYDSRLKRIKNKTGAVVCNTHTESLEEVIYKNIDGPGVGVAIEATGAHTVPNIGIRSLRPRGSLVLFSCVWQPEKPELGIVHMKELNVLGACRSLNCFSKCLEMMAMGQLNMAELIDIKLPLNQCEKAMQMLKQNKKDVFKAVLKP